MFIVNGVSGASLHCINFGVATELACGTGQFTIPLARRAGSWEATDFSANMLSKAARRGKGCGASFAIQDATALTYADGSFDAVLIANALHIMPEPEKAVAEIRRVLKPGGLLLAPTFVRGDAPKSRLHVKFIRCLGLRVYHNWSAPELLEWLSGQGFPAVKSEILGPAGQPMCFAVSKKQ